MAIARRSAALALALTFGAACADDGDPSASAGNQGGVAGAATRGGAGGGTGGAGLAGGGSGNSGAAFGGNGTTNGAAGGETRDAGVGAAGASPGMTGGSSGGAAGSTPDAGGTGDSSATCAALATEYAGSFARQLTCDPGGGDQCQDRIEAAPGCDCLVFIEPKDPFAIEDLLNVYINWLDADCEDPTCPSACPSGTSGTCGANGLCTAEP